MLFFLDMNISPGLCSRLRAAGHEACSLVIRRYTGRSREVIIGYARDQGQALVTHDLDFGSILAITRAAGPSVCCRTDLSR
jgi:predicted nuclease of predicted toxin-antitoxin system